MTVIRYWALSHRNEQVAVIRYHDGVTEFLNAKTMGVWQESPDLLQRIINGDSDVIPMGITEGEALVRRLGGEP